MTESGRNFDLSISFDTEPPAVTVIGVVDTVTAPSVAAALDAVIDEGRRIVVLDLRRTTHIDGPGAQVISEAAARARSVGQTVEIRAASADSSETAAHPAPSFARSEVDLLDASLQLVTSLADAAVANSVGASITMERDGRPVTVAASTRDVVAVDLHQYETGQGPCLDAKTYGERFHVEALADETRWPAFVPLAMQHGVRSILSSPLRTKRGEQGSLNLYAGVERAFGGREQQLAALCATTASHVLSTTEHDLADPQRNSRFTAALDARRTIHQAQGIIMARDNIAGNDALARIMKEARMRHVTAVAHATEIVNAFHDPGPTESARATP